jgi:hypothetical protein
MPQRGPQRPQTPIREAIYARRAEIHRHPAAGTFFALPQALSEWSQDESARAAFEARAKANTAAQVDAFEAGVPSTRVVRVPHASIFQSSEAEVLPRRTAAPCCLDGAGART